LFCTASTLYVNADGIGGEFLFEEFQDDSVKRKWLEVMELLINDIYERGKYLKV
jgi:hypothetical protein